MLPTPKKYTAWPRVLEAGKASDVVVAPEERAFLLRDGEEYTVFISATNGDEHWYHTPTSWTRYDLVAKDGVLRFTHTFPTEQEYQLLLRQGDTKLADIPLYALEKDLYERTPLRGDLHSHTCRSDGLSDAAALFGYFREMGYDFQALTDHNRYYPGGEIDEAYEGVTLGITHVQGEEVHTPTSTVHIVHVGGRSSVADIYVHDRERYEREMVEYRKKVPAHVPAPFAERYAQAMWSTDRIHEAGGLAIFPHPFWRPGQNRCFNVCDDLTELFLTSGMFDAFELVGAMSQPGINRAVAMWQELRAKGYDIPVVGSSDVHNIAAKDFPYHFTVCFAKENTNDAIIAAVKEGMSVAAELSGVEYEREFRAYGKLRLVSYAQFLFSNYFSDLQRICQGEGVAMRNYAMGLTPAATIEAQVAQTKDFRDRFFGRKPAVLPDASILAFENKWRERHLQGPLTRGSVIDGGKVTRQL